ncbi:MAG TPA: hypothetical protein VL172_14110, partial [Kofleriaceae bacterium]|nr:hypothetical protein [Kofleriaceae bacterium]
FIGFTTDHIGGIWIGRDDFTPIGVKATGGVTAAPIWLEVMKVAEGNAPARPFPPPDDIYFVRADEEDGQPGSPWSSSARLIPFVRGTVPARFLGGVGLGPFRSAAAPFARAGVPESTPAGPESAPPPPP